MKYLKKYNESLDKATYLQRCREISNDLEIYSEDLPFEMDDWTVDYVDANQAAQLNGASAISRNNFKRFGGSYAEGFVVGYEHKDLSLNHLIEVGQSGGTSNQISTWGLNKVITKAKQDADKFFTKFAKKYDMVYKFISIDVDFNDDIDWVTAIANGDLDRDLMTISIEFCLQMPNMKYLKSQNEAIEDISGSMSDRDLIDYNASLMKLENEFEVYAEDLPFEMSDIKAEPVRGIKLGGLYWYYDVTFSYNNQEMNDTISRDYLMKSIILDGYVDLSNEPIAWIDMIKAQIEPAMAKFARKYDLEFIPMSRGLKVLINMEDSDSHNITYNTVFKKKR